MYKELISLKEQIERLPADIPETARMFLAELHIYLGELANEILLYDDTVITPDYVKDLLLILSRFFDNLKEYIYNQTNEAGAILSTILLNLDYAIEGGS